MSDTAPAPKWDLADRLAKARRWAGLEQEDLAEDFGMTHQAISKYERGLSIPKLVVIKQWALRTKVPVEWLLEDDAVPKNPDPPEPEPKGKRPRKRRTPGVTSRYPLRQLVAA
jgi:transcriptional regulator with XRE-family HTH domain